MGWINPTAGQDAIDYAFLSQFPSAIQERDRALGSRYWPPPSFVWVTGTISAVHDNLDGSYTLTASDDGTGNSTNFWFGHNANPSNSSYPTHYDLIIDDDFTPQNCLHLHIYGSTNATGGNATYKVDSASDHILEDAATGGFFDPNYTITSLLNSLVGRTYHIIVQNGIWWHERWPVWPNDMEQWVSTTLQNGAKQKITSLSLVGGAGTTATATCIGHQLIVGDDITIAGATSSGNHYNGSFTVATVLDADTFTYTLSATDDPAAGGNPTVQCTTPYVAVGAYDPTPDPTGGSFTFPVNAWSSGYVLMCQGNDGSQTKLRRITVTGNDSNNLFFARQSFSVAGQYAVLSQYNISGNPHRSRYRVYNFIDTLCSRNDIHTECNPFSGKAYLWTNQAWTNYYTYLPTNPTDTVGTTKLPASSVPVNTGFTVGVPALDVDVYTDITDTLNPPDKYWCPDIWRTIHGWQLAAEGLVTDNGGDPAWVRPISYNGAHAIPYLTRATTFFYAGINATSASTSSLTGFSINTTLSSGFFPRFPFNVYWAVLDPTTGDNISAGTGSVDLVSGTVVLSKDTGSFGSSETSKTLYVSKGWTRQYDNEFVRMYARQCFIPLPGGGGAPVDPPTSASPGNWSTRFPSTKYREAGPEGLVSPTYEYRSFVTNDYARHVGTNYNDPVIQDGSGTPTTSGTFANYYANFYEGVLDPTKQAALLASMSGTIDTNDVPSGGNVNWIGDTTKNWWTGGAYASPPTAAGVNSIVGLWGTDDGGGTSTQISDSTMAGNGFWSTGPAGFLGFHVKITKSGVDYYRQITAYGGGTTFSFAALPAGVSASGATYSVVWPKGINNRWGHPLGGSHDVTLTYPDGTTQTFGIFGNDDHRLYFNSPIATPPAGTTYLINERTPGLVYKFNGSGTGGVSSWDVPTGNDPRTGTAWLPPAMGTGNQPNKNTDYGRARKGDFPLLTLFSELQSFLNTLIHLRKQAGWTANGATNYKFGQDNGNINFAGGSGAQDNAKANYAGSGSTDNDNPFACAYTATKCNGGGSIACYDYAVGRRYAYGTATNSVNVQQSANDWYAISRIPADPATGGAPGQAASSSCPTKADFDAEGDGLLQNLWHLYSSDSPSGSSSRSSGTACGSTLLPTPNDIGPAPAVCPTDCNWYAGYVVDNSGWSIFKYNVTGGFNYT